MKDMVPYWENILISSFEDLLKANNQQKQFYYLFKSEFLKGRYLNIEDNSNYAFVLMFDIANAFNEHRDYNLTKMQLYTLAENYPIVKEHIEKTLSNAFLGIKREDAENSLQAYSKTEGQLCQWITSEEKINVHGIELSRGNFYIGECYRLPNHIIRNNYDYMRENKSSYIYGPVLNPNLPIADTKNFSDAFCSYNDMTPAWRYEYLMWLSKQRANSDFPIEIILFYLYGCEIRMFIDSTTKKVERDKILLDLIELYESLYFENTREYECELKYRLSEFIVCALIKYYPYRLEDNRIVRLLKENITFQRYYIARRIAIKNGISVEDAFDIAKSLFDIDKLVPSKYLSIAEKIFSEYISSKIPSINFKTLKKENRYICYCNNNCLFNSEIINLYYDIDVIPNEVCWIREDITRCYWLIHSKFQDYNHIIERTNGKETIAAILRLPEEVNITEFPRIQALITHILEEMQSSTYMKKSITWILNNWEYERKNDRSIHKEYASSITSGLRRIGFGIVPDYTIDEIRFGFGDNCIIYKNKENLIVEPTPYYKQIVLFIKLVAQVIHTDYICDSDIDFIEQYIKCQNLTDGNKLHLIAFAKWTFTSKKKRLDKNTIDYIKILSSQERELIGKSLIKLICKIENISSKRIEGLKKVLFVLGLKSDNIHTQIHYLSTNDDEFAIVEKKSDALEYEISTQHLSVNQPTKTNVIIDSDKLSKLERQTKIAHELLAEIFIEEEKQLCSRADNTLTTWRNILDLLLTKEIWERKEIENICKAKGLMLGDILEQINDFAYSTVNDAVVEDDGENIYVTLEYTKELI